MGPGILAYGENFDVSVGSTPVGPFAPAATGAKLDFRFFVCFRIRPGPGSSRPRIEMPLRSLASLE